MGCFPLPRSTPAQMGVEPGVLRKIITEFNAKQLGVHSVLFLRHGSVIAEGWWKPYRAELPHMLFSLSKSFTSTAIGFAVQEGLLSLDDRLVSFFPDKLPARPCENMEKITLRDMLSMSTGHEQEPAFLASPPPSDWSAAFLKSYVELEPGSRFVYNTPSTYMLSALLQRVTGQTAEDYLTPRLFEPLGIADHRWEKSPGGVSAGGFGLNLTTESIAKFGTFLLNRGEFNGKCLLNADWIDDATSFHVQNFGSKDWGQGYGYQFWRCVPEGVYRADGMFGQYCVVLPQQDMVIAVTSGSNNMQAELDVIWEHLLPALRDQPLPEDAAEQAALEETLSALAFPCPVYGTPGPIARAVSGRVYTLSSNQFGLEKIRFAFAETDRITLWAGGREISLAAGQNEWLESESGIPVGEVHAHIALFCERSACAGHWEGDTYTLTVHWNTAPFTDTYRCAFDEKGLLFSPSRDLDGPPPSLTIFGR